jgi:hypothetical protein
MMKTSSWLARFFDWNREVIEAAETPFAKLAVFVLPVIAPIVPAFMTALHVAQFMRTQFHFGEATDTIAVVMASITGFVLELMGYVGVISFIQHIFQWIKTKTDEYLVPAALSGLAYASYIVVMYWINVKLAQYFGSPVIVTQIVGMLSFLSVPAGLLAANHLTRRADEEQSEKRHQEAREDKKYKLALKAGVNPNQIVGAVRGKKEKHASDFKEQIPAMLQEHFDKTGKVLELTEITAKLKLDHGKNKGFVSTARSQWMEKNAIPKGDKFGF